MTTPKLPRKIREQWAGNRQPGSSWPRVVKRPWRAFVIVPAVLAMMGGHARAATSGCHLSVPAVRAQADGSGTVTGHVTGRCSFAWHSVNLIQFRDRWHTLGVERHAGGAAGAYVRQPVDRDDYHGDGYWRELVKVYDQDGTLRARIVGPVSEFAS